MAAIDKMNLTRGELSTGQQTFTNHYFLEGCSVDFQGKDIAISFSELYDAVTTFKEANDLTDDEVGLCFVHCYSPEENTLYYRLQLCKLTLSPDTNHGRRVYDISGPYTWFEIKDGSFSPTDISDLFDNDYLDHFYYTGSGSCTGGEQLSTDTGEEKYVRNFTMPWGLEALKQFQDNDGTPVNTADYTLHLAAISHTVSIPSDAGVAYPHSMAMYLVKNATTILLDNNIYPAQAFKNKAANFNSMCPPQCAVYILIQN
jgi:hypothetical protein